MPVSTRTINVADSSAPFDADQIATGTATDGYVIASNAGVPTWEAVSGGGATDYSLYPIQAGVYAQPPLSAISPFTVATADRMYAIPFLTSGGDIDRIECNVKTAGASGSLIRLGIYEDDNGMPGDLLVDGGTVASTTTGSKEVTVSVTLPEGWVWLALAWQGGVAAGENRGGRSGYRRGGISDVAMTLFSYQCVKSGIDSAIGALPATYTSPVYETAPNGPTISVRGA